MDLFSLAFQYVHLLQVAPLGPVLYIPLILILVDVITGMLAAIKQGIFTSKKIMTFLQSNVAPYLVVVASVFVVYLLSGSTTAAQAAILLGVTAHTISMLGSITENLKELGVPAPLVQEVQQIEQSFYQGYPPVMQPPAPVYVPPIEKQPTQVQPIVQEPVRVNTPPPLPPLAPAAPPQVTPPVSEEMPALLPQGL